MKKILITGKNSYIGNNLEKWLIEKDRNYLVEKISLRNASWKEANFSNFDVVIHMAGIAHVSANPKEKELYLKVNRDLAIEVAKKAKKENVEQFIFMSSIIIYGDIDTLKYSGLIDKDTPFNPENVYGQSKLEADLAIQKLSDAKFTTSVIRTPVVYGPNSKGNFEKIVKLSEITLFFPKIDSSRSMIYIENLCEFIRIVIEDKKNGVFFPQNEEYISISEMVKDIAELKGKKIYFTKFFNPLIELAAGKYFFLNKIFGRKIYNKDLSGDFRYCVVGYKDSIKKSIGIKMSGEK